MSATAPAILIVLGQDKGGTGKSMLASNLAVGLARLGLSVAAVDLDARQGALVRWCERRAEASRADGRALEMPACKVIAQSRTDSVSLNEERDFTALAAVLEWLDRTADAVIIDTPSGDSYLARLAVSLADVLLTPVGDSAADFDALALTGDGSMAVVDLVEQAREKRAGLGDTPVDWVVVRNRREVGPRRLAAGSEGALADLSARHGFRLASGLSERAICRSLYARGLSVFEGSPAQGSRRSAGSVSELVGAREEVGALIAALGLRLDAWAVAGGAARADAGARTV